MFRRCRGRLLLACAGFFGLAASAYAIISAELPLSTIVGDAEYVLVAKVESIDPAKPLVVLAVQEDLSGKAPFRRLAVSFKGDADARKLNHVPQLLKRLAPDLPVLLFVLEPQNKKRLGFAYTNGTWFQVLGQPTGDGDRLAWSLTHGEPFLRRTYKGTTAELRKLVIDGLAGKAKLPKVNKKEEPGFGPEVPAKDKSSRSSRADQLSEPRPSGSGARQPLPDGRGSERWVGWRPASFTHTPMGGPLFGVIPTLGVGAPLVVLAALFPAVFGGVLLLFRQWVAFITVFSTNSTLLLAQWAFNNWWPNVLRDSWIGSEAGLWFIMTLVALFGTIWAWRRQLARQARPDPAPDAPRTTELRVLWLLAGLFVLVSVLTPLLSWLFAPRYNPRTDLACAAMAVLTLGVLAGAIYRTIREYTGTVSPLATEGVMIVAILFGQIGYTAYRWGAEDLGVPAEAVANVTGAAPSVAGLNEPKFDRIVWQFAPKRFTGSIVAAPLVHGDTLWVGAARAATRLGTLYCLNRADGTIRGEFFGKDGNLKQMISSPVIADGWLYIGEGFHEDSSCRMFCIDAAERKELWNFPTEGQTEPAPCVVGGKVYFGAGNDGIYCVDALKGEQIWRYPPADYKGRLLRCGSSPAVVANRLYAGSAVDRNQKDDKGETSIFCLDAQTGAQQWKHAVPLPAWAGPVVAGDRVFYALGNGDVVSDADTEAPAGLMLCVDAASGKEHWHYDVPNGILDRPAIDTQCVYFGCRDGYVYCLNRPDGKLRWKAHLNAPVIASPVLARCPGYAQTAHVFVVSTAGTVACLDPATGAAHWSQPLTTDQDSHFSATPSVLVRRTDAGDRRQIYVAGSIGGVPGRPVVFCLEDFVKVE